MKRDSDAIRVEEMERTDAVPTLRYSYVTDSHYAVKVTKTHASWQVELVLQSFSEHVTKSSEEILFESHIEDPRVIVAKISGRPVAWMELGLEKWNNRMRVWHLLVDEEYRRKGVGSLLIGHGVRIAMEAGARMLVLETQSCNIPAVSFYLKHGFELVGFDLASYSNKDVEMGMVRLELGRRIPTSSS